MNRTFVVLLMISCHIVDDYYLQGWLAQAKQKKYWQDNAPEPLYRYDYIWALIMHSFSWTFMIMLPIAIYQSFTIGGDFVLAFVINMAAHSVTDYLKANVKTINLWTDQWVHIWQILTTASIFLI